MSWFLGNQAVQRNCRILSVVWALGTAVLLLFAGGNMPGEGFPVPFVTALELGAHLVLFFGLAWLASRGFAVSEDSTGASISHATRRKRVLAVVLAYCVLLEIAQIPVPGRGFEWIDIVFGALGAILGRGWSS